MIRAFEQEEVDEFAEHAAIPVINGLTDETHPCRRMSSMVLAASPGSRLRTACTHRRH